MLAIWRIRAGDTDTKAHRSTRADRERRVDRGGSGWCRAGKKNNSADWIGTRDIPNAFISLCLQKSGVLRVYKKKDALSLETCPAGSFPICFEAAFAERK